MNILSLLFENARRDPLTLRFPQRPASPAGYRGLVHIDPSLCVGCGTCAHVCSPGCITLQDDGMAYRWRYDPGQCTFCARCVEYCPLQALTMDGQQPPAYAWRDELVQTVEQEYPLCPQCGRPAQPVSPLVLGRAFAELSPEVIAWSRLCLACRQAQRQPGVARMLAGQEWRS
jgi:formate hydrogenlyase subunit 6/NADH:ubiquinone oxidoreductase subunit I